MTLDSFFPLNFCQREDKTSTFGHIMRFVIMRFVPPPITFLNIWTGDVFGVAMLLQCFETIFDRKINIKSLEV